LLGHGHLEEALAAKELQVAVRQPVELLQQLRVAKTLPLLAAVPPEEEPEERTVALTQATVRQDHLGTVARLGWLERARQEAAEVERPPILHEFLVGVPGLRDVRGREGEWLG